MTESADGTPKAGARGVGIALSFSYFLDENNYYLVEKKSLNMFNKGHHLIRKSLDSVNKLIINLV